MGQSNLAVRRCTAEPPGPTSGPMARLLWWQPPCLYGSIKPSPCPTGLAKKLDLLRPTGGSGITWFVLHYNSNTLQLCMLYAALIDGACDFLRVCTIVFGRPIAKRLVFSGDGPFGPVKADPSRQGAPMVSPISMVGCQRAGRQQQAMPCHAKTPLVCLITATASTFCQTRSIRNPERGLVPALICTWAVDKCLSLQ